MNSAANNESFYQKKNNTIEKTTNDVVDLLTNRLFLDEILNIFIFVPIG